MASTVGLFTGGTTGAMDGTLVSVGTGTNPIATAALNVGIPLHYRVIDDVTGLDSGQDTESAVTITAANTPTGYTASSDDATYVESWTGAVATGGNKPVYVRQGAHLDPGTYTLGLTFPAFVTGTRLAAPTGLSSTAGDTEVALAWTAVTGATGHQARYRTGGVTPGEWSAWVATATASSHEFSGLDTGVEYDFEVRGVDARGAGVSAAASTTTSNVIFSDDFNRADGALLSDNGWVHIAKDGHQTGRSRDGYFTYQNAGYATSTTRWVGYDRPDATYGNDYEARMRIIAMGTDPAVSPARIVVRGQAGQWSNDGAGALPQGILMAVSSSGGASVLLITSAASATTLGTLASGSVGIGDTIFLRAEGSTITWGVVDGVSDSVTDATFATGVAMVGATATTTPFVGDDYELLAV